MASSEDNLLDFEAEDSLMDKPAAATAVPSRLLLLPSLIQLTLMRLPLAMSLLPKGLLLLPPLPIQLSMMTSPFARSPFQTFLFQLVLLLRWLLRMLPLSL